MPLAPYLLLALAMIGLADTAYLTLHVFLQTAPNCLIQGCEVVLASSYSKFFGVPLAYLGLMYYVYMFCLAILLAYDPQSRGLRLGALLYTVVGALLSIAFLYIQGVLIGAYCQYCLISIATSFLLFGVALYHFRSVRS